MRPVSEIRALTLLLAKASKKPTNGVHSGPYARLCNNYTEDGYAYHWSSLLLSL
jgi:hypothetical protein